jgi:DNA-directed RNA polymerase subunit E'/Rpb7
MTKIFKKYKICTLINISISQISNNTIDDAILEKIQAKYENKITKYGYIKENSIEIIKRSPGTAMKEHFNSSFQFKAVCYALICNPSIDTILEANIVSSNNAGFKAEVRDDNAKVVIDIIIPRLTSGIKHEYDIEDLSIGSDVSVKICRKRYHYNDNKIVIIGLVINNPNDDNTEEPEELVDTINAEKNEDDNFSEDGSYEQDDAIDSTDDSDSVIDLVDLKESDIDVVNTENDVVNIETDDDDDDDDDDYDYDYD